MCHFNGKISTTLLYIFILLSLLPTFTDAQDARIRPEVRTINYRYITTKLDTNNKAGIRIMVLDAENEELLPGVRFFIPEINRGGYTDEAGIISLQQMTTDTFSIIISCLSYQTDTIRGLAAKPDKEIYFKHLLRPRATEISAIEINAFQELNLSEFKTLLARAGSFQFTQQVSDAPATVYVINQTIIQARGYQYLIDILHDIPEIEIQSRSNYEHLSFIGIRGVVGNDKFILLQDGFRINAPNNESLAVAQQYSLVGVKQVEIIMGPAASVYNAEAFSRIINIITKDGKELNGGELKVSAGQYQTGSIQLAAGRQFSNSLSFNISGNYYRSEEPYFPKYYPNEYRWYTDVYRRTGQMLISPGDTVIMPIVPYSTPTRAYSLVARLQFKDFSVSYNRNFISASTSNGTRPEYNFFSKDAIGSHIVESFHARHKYKSKNERTMLVTNLYHGVYELGKDFKFINAYSGFLDAWKYAKARVLRIEEQFFHSFSPKVQMILGGVFEDMFDMPRTSDLPFRYNRSLPPDLQNQYYLGSNVRDLNGNDLTIYQDFYFIEQQTYSAYSQFQYKNNKNIDITADLRFDNNTRYGTGFNPRIGIVYTPTEVLKLKTLFGRAFKAPTALNSYQTYGVFIPVRNANNEISGLTSPFYHVPNPNLKPEILTAFEFGGSYRINDVVSFFIDAYYTEVKDLIRPAYFTGESFQNVPVDITERYVNKGLLVSYGGTVRAEVNWRITNGHTLSFNPAYSWAEGTLAQNRLPYTAKHTIKSQLDYSFRRLNISLRLNYRSQSWHPGRNEQNNEVKIPTYAILNGYISYRNPLNLGKLQNRLFLRIDNLTDARYYNLGIEDMNIFLLTPQDPIRIQLGFSVTF